MANKLKEMRFRRMMSIEDLSRKSGISRTRIWQIETHRARNVTVNTMQALADALNMPINKIFFANDG